MQKLTATVLHQYKYLIVTVIILTVSRSFSKKRTDPVLSRTKFCSVHRNDNERIT